MSAPEVLLKTIRDHRPINSAFSPYRPVDCSCRTSLFRESCDINDFEEHLADAIYSATHPADSP